MTEKHTKFAWIPPKTEAKNDQIWAKNHTNLWLKSYEIKAKT